jgi:hypothetical protein
MQEKMKAKVDAIAAHGINVFVNRQLIYNYPESLLAEKGILVIEHADFEGVERLSLVTGGEIASTFDRPDLVKLGKCELIEEIMIGEDKVRVCSTMQDAQGALSTPTRAAHQIFRRRRWRSLHRCPPRLDKPDDRRSRALAARRALCALADREGDTSRARRRLRGDAHGVRRRRDCTHGTGQEGDRGRGVCTRASPDPDDPRGQRGIRLVGPRLAPACGTLRWPGRCWTGYGLSACSGLIELTNMVMQI